MRDPFHSSKYSIRRAKHHIEDFKRQKHAFFSSNPYKNFVETDLGTGDRISKVKLIKPLPEDFEGIVFDAVNNLRSALDQAIFSLLNQEFAKFPFADTHANFKAAIKGRCKGLLPEMIALIESFKPYRGGDGFLWALNRLCNTNKHAVITPAITVVRGVVPDIHILEGSANSIAPRWNSEKNEVEVYRIGKETRFKANIKITMDVAITGIPEIERSSADAVLNQFTFTVEKIVNRLEANAVSLGII